MVIGEAVRLGTPVLSTRTSSADEMILEPDVGWVCENSTQGLAQALEGLLKDPQWIGSKRDSMSSVPTDNETALQQFRALLTDRKL